MTKPWILWTHDPCPEGGWHVRSMYDTQEEAIAAADRLHEEEERHYREMVEHCKEEEVPPKRWPRRYHCYDKCVVTPGVVYERVAPKDKEEAEA